MVYRGVYGVNYMMFAENGKLGIVWDNWENDGTYRKGYKAVKVNKAQGFSWKLNKASVSCDSGCVLDLLKLFVEYPAYANATFNHFKEV